MPLPGVILYIQYWTFVYWSELLTVSSLRYFSVVIVDIPKVPLSNCAIPCSRAASWLFRISSLSQGSWPDNLDVIMTSYVLTAASAASEHFVTTNVSQDDWTFGISPGVLIASTYSWTSAANPANRYFVSEVSNDHDSLETGCCQFHQFDWLL